MKLAQNTGMVAVVAAIAVILAGWIVGLPLGLVLAALLVIFTVAAARSSGPYVYRKVLGLIPILLIVTFFTFLLVNFLPGDPAVNLLGPGATPQAVEEMRARLNLDDPVPVRYLEWLADAMGGDLGTSPFRNEPVTEGIGNALPVSLQLMVYAQFIALAVAIPLGVLTAYRGGTRVDRTLSTGAFGLLAIPNYILAVLLILFFALGGLSIGGFELGFRWLPASRYVHFGDDPVLHFKHMLLPALALALGPIAVYMRLLRTDMIATLQEDYINVAKAKGMGTMRILVGHALRPSSFTLLTVLGINIGALIGGSLIIEAIFTLPGLGSYLYTAVFQRDYIVIQGFVVVIAVGYVFANFAVDLLYAVLDPRVRHARAIA